MALLSISDAKSIARTSYGQRMIYKSAGTILNEQATPVTADEQFDVFLSHSYTDTRLDDEALLGVWELLHTNRYTVYVDWIVDRQLDRASVTPDTARILRNRMGHSKCLLFVSSTNSAQSKWMPWELGCVDGQKAGRAAVFPLTGGTGFDGQEYLGIYPYIDVTNGRLWVHRDTQRFVRFDEWLRGANP